MAISKKSIYIEDYSPEWKSNFNSLAKVYREHLKDFEITIVHVGSTAVPGLCAKPVIDIDIVINSLAQLKEIIPILVKLGYEYLGEVAIPNRFVFRPPDLSVPNDGTGRLWQKHHLYCCLADSTALANHIILRDALRNDELLAREYAELKKMLAANAQNMDEYVMGKTSFITKILAAHGMSTEELLAIEKKNKNVIPALKR